MSGKWPLAGALLAGMIIGGLTSPVVVALAAESPASIPVKQLRLFAHVFNAFRQGYVEPVDEGRLMHACLSGMVSGIDADSAFLDTGEFEELKTPAAGTAGVGLELGISEGSLKIVSPIEDTPSDRAGIGSGDVVLKIDETPTKGLPLTAAVKLLRGKPDTEVVLTIARRGETEPLVFRLKRQIIRVQSVKSKFIQPGYAYIRMSQFNEAAVPSLARQLESLFRQEPVQGLVLDLRNNPGGLLAGSIGTAAAFLPAETLIATMDGRLIEAKRSYRAVAEDYLQGRDRQDYLRAIPTGARKVPMIVLVNNGTAAGAEIVAGALQDQKRAVLLGTRTFGRASIQTVLPMPEHQSALKLTTARWQTPAGRSIHAKGIEPDIASDNAGNSLEWGTPGDGLLAQALSLLKEGRLRP